jgi:hypothetical protein
MSNYDNTNSGILTTNDRKRNDRDPSHSGSINIDGVEYWLSAWVNTGKDGGKLAGQRYFSIKVRPKDSQPQKQGREQVPGKFDMKAAEALAKTTASTNHEAALTADFDDDIPF